MNLIKKLGKYEYLANIFENDIHNLNSSSLRFFYKYIINNINRIEGDILDLGVYRGRSLITTAIILKKLRSKRKVYGFDTFSGFPKLSKFDQRVNFRDSNYFSSFYIFTALHGLHLLGGLFFWGKVSSQIFKLEEKKILDEKNKVEALSLYWMFLLIIWLVFFLVVYVFNDAVIAWCKELIS